MARQFDRWAPTYDDEPWYRAQAREVLRHLETDFDGTLVDIGCGTGWLLRRVIEERPGATGIGLDVSTGMLQEARQHAAGSPRLSFVKADWEGAGETALGGGPHADVVTCVSAFHYFSDPRRAAEAICRTLRPGGLLLLMERDKAGSILTRMWDLLHRRVLRDHVVFYDSAELLTLLAQVGFVDVSIVSRLRRYLWQGKLYTNLVLISARRANGEQVT